VSPPGTLAEIVARKRAEMADVRVAGSLRAIGWAASHAPRLRHFALSLAATRDEGRPALIAEIKRASPSRGLIRADFDPAAHARAYAAGGATCLSVLTEPDWFQGGPQHLRDARNACDLPILCKDFIIDPWQIAEAREAGADCVLLIVAALSDEELRWFAAIAYALGMDVLVEAHDADEVTRALRVDGAIIGINNRDLKTLVVDPLRALALATDIPGDRLVVAESGLSRHDDILRYMKSGVGCFLVGEALMREADVELATRRLLTGQ